MEYILIGVLITLGSWMGGKFTDAIDNEPKETVVKETTLQCVLVEAPEEE